MLDYHDVDVGEANHAAPHDLNVSKSQLVDLLGRRRSVAPFHLTEPGPNSDELIKLLTLATRVPDHGILEPWRIILVQGSSRVKLGTGLAAAFLKANVKDEPARADLAIRKIKSVLAAPLIVVVVSRADPSARIPEWEQILSAGAVCMNLLTAACALGYSSTWLTGWTAYDPAALRILGVKPSEKIAGIIPIGTTSESQQDRARPSLQKMVTVWSAP